MVGWSTTGGDLRIGHFVGLHAMQVLPLVALGLLLLAPRVLALRSEGTRTRLVVIAAAAWTGLVLLLTVQALRAHATQVDPDGSWFACPLEVQQKVWPTEDYELARSVLGVRLPEDDLFAGVREHVERSSA